MAKRGQSVQVPIPTLGVLPHINPAEVGHAGLASAENFIYRDGLFETREGVEPTTSDIRVNLLPEDASSFETGNGGITQTAGLSFARTDTRGAVHGQYAMSDLSPTWKSGERVTWPQVTLSGSGPVCFSLYISGDVNGGTPGDVTFGLGMTVLDASDNDVTPSSIKGTGAIYIIDESTFMVYGLYESFQVGNGYKVTPFLEWKAGTGNSRITLFDAAKLERTTYPTPFTLGGDALDSDFDSQAPLNFMQYDYVSGGSADTDRIVGATNKTIWHYQKATGEWVEIDNTPTGGVSTPIISDLPSEANNSQIVIRGWDQDGVTNIVCTGRAGQMRIWDGDEDNPLEEFGYSSGTDDVLSDVRCLAVAGSRLVAGNFKRTVDAGPTTTLFPDAITYSNTISASSNPGYKAWPLLNIIRLADTPGEIVAMQEMGSLALAVYKTDAVYLILVQTGTYPFRPDLKASGISGPCSPLSVVSLADNTHAYLGRNGAVYLFDGSPPRSLGDHIQKWIRDTMEFDMIERVWLEYDRALNELHVFYPAKSSQAMTRSVVINMSQPGYPMYPMRWKEDALGGAFNWTAGISASQNRDVRWEEMTEPWSAYTITWAELRTKTRAFILGNQAGTIFRVNGHDDANQPIPAYAETGLRDLGQQTQRAVVKEIDHMFNRPEESQDVTISVSTSERGEMRDIREPRTIDISDPGRMVTRHRLSTHMFGLRIDADALESIEWSGSEIAVAPRGKR